MRHGRSIVLRRYSGAPAPSAGIAGVSWSISSTSGQPTVVAVVAPDPSTSTSSTSMVANAGRPLVPDPSVSTSSTSLVLTGGPTGLFTLQLLAAHAPWLAADSTGDLYRYLSTLGSLFDTVAGIVYDQGYPDDPDFAPGWSTLLDVDLCPDEFLPFLAQFNGTVVAPGTDGPTARAIIRAESGFRRGTFASIGSAITSAQTPTTPPGSYTIVERQNISGADAYHFLIIVDPGTLTNGTDGLRAAVDATKPAGLQYDVLLSTRPLVSQYSRLFSAISKRIDVATLADVT